MPITAKQQPEATQYSVEIHTDRDWETVILSMVSW